MCPRRRLATGVCLALAALFGWLFYVRHWRWRDCIRAALSSCVTTGGDNLIGGGRFWGVIAIAFAALAVGLALPRGRR